jgi:hypothetical protein
MEFFYWGVGIYLVFGFFKASSHIASGKSGTAGYFWTFLFVMFLWPFV